MEKYLETTRLIFEDFKTVEKKDFTDIYSFLSKSKLFIDMSLEMQKEFGGGGTEKDIFIKSSEQGDLELIFKDGSSVCYDKEDDTFSLTCNENNSKKSMAYPRYVSMKEFHKLARQENIKF